MPINKIADIQDLNQIARSCVIERLLKTRYTVEKTGLPYSDHMQDHWLRLWEYSGAIIESHLDKRMRVLDAGGTGTIFSYYMAFEGCEVHTIDIDGSKVKDADVLSEQLGLKMYHSVQRVEHLDYPDCYFDAVYCICVIEHLSLEHQPHALIELGRVLKPGGVLSITFDYGKDGADNPFVDGIQVRDRLIIPTGLELIGNTVFDTTVSDRKYTDIDNTFGSLFFKKPGELSLKPSNPPSVKTPVLIDWYSKEISIDYYRCEV